MNTAIQAGFFIRKYGMERAAKEIAALGYENVFYTLQFRYDDPFNTTWGDKEIGEFCDEVKGIFQKNGVKIKYLAANIELFNDHKPDTTAARIQYCVNAAKVAKMLGADGVAVKPASFCKARADLKEASKKNTLEAFDQIKKACDEQGVEMFILNNFAYPAVGACYGCSGDELKELCEQYKARAIVNPIHAQKSAKLASDMISVLGDSLEAFLVSDCESGLNSSMMPLMGCLDYLSIKHALEKAPEDSCIVLMMDGYVQHFEKFPDNEKVLTALGGYLAGVVDLLAGKI